MGFPGKGCQEPPKFSGLDWVAGVVRLRGRSILMIQGYFDCGIGAKGVNLVKFRQVVELIHLLHLPFVWCADWNMLPRDVMGAKWPQSINGQILSPNEPTCSIGNREIDFCIISNQDYCDPV